MAVMLTCLKRVAMWSVLVLATVVKGQDGMDDLTDMDSMLAPPSGSDGGGGGAQKREKELTVIQQTTLALQQLGIVIGWFLILLNCPTLALFWGLFNDTGLFHCFYLLFWQPVILHHPALLKAQKSFSRVKNSLHFPSCVFKVSTFAYISNDAMLFFSS